MSTFWPALQQMASLLCPIALLQHEKFVRCLHLPYYSTFQLIPAEIRPAPTVQELPQA